MRDEPLARCRSARSRTWFRQALPKDGPSVYRQGADSLKYRRAACLGAPGGRVVVAGVRPAKVLLYFVAYGVGGSVRAAGSCGLPAVRPRATSRETGGSSRSDHASLVQRRAPAPPKRPISSRNEGLVDDRVRSWLALRSMGLRRPVYGAPRQELPHRSPVRRPRPPVGDRGREELQEPLAGRGPRVDDPRGAARPRPRRDVRLPPRPAAPAPAPRSSRRLPLPDELLESLVVARWATCTGPGAGLR